MSVYSYEIGSAIKLNRNFGRLHFPDDTKAGLAIQAINNAVLENVCKCSLSKKLVAYDKKAFLKADVADLTSISFTLYNSVDPKIQKRFYFPGMEIIRKVDGVTRDDAAMQDVINTIAGVFIAQGITDENGVALDRQLIPGLPKYSLDVVADDLADTSRTQ